MLQKHLCKNVCVSMQNWLSSSLVPQAKYKEGDNGMRADCCCCWALHCLARGWMIGWTERHRKQKLCTNTKIFISLSRRVVESN